MTQDWPKRVSQFLATLDDLQSRKNGTRICLSREEIQRLATYRGEALHLVVKGTGRRLQTFYP